MSFLDIALPLAERGFRVFPLIPRQKAPVKMSWGDHFDAATTDLDTLKLWDSEVPDANVALSPDEYFCYLETDAESELKEACKDLPPEVWDTARVTSGRPDRAYYIFRQTNRTRNAVIKDKALRRPGKENLFEFKAFRTYVTGPGSIHPITGNPYVAEWRRIPALPDILLDRLCELYGAPKATVQTMTKDVLENTRKLEAFLEYYEVPVVGEWFNKGKSWLLPIECPWLDQHENANQGTSTCVLFTEGSGYGFDCKHRCAGKTWHDFRAELESRFTGKEKFRFLESESATVSIGEPQPAKLAQPPRPLYPIEVWDGTAVGEFAKLCGHDNNIPRKMYAESFRCALGAVVGDRIACPGVDGALPRSFTVIVAPKGKGKGTAIRRAVRFFSQTFNSSWMSITPGLLSGERDFVWKPKGIGAWMAAASSVPGMSRLTKDLDSTIKNKVHMTWGNTLPRILSVHEEMKTFLSTLFIEGGVGSGMEGVVCQLWDDISFHGTATGTREAVYGEMMFSLLAGVTEQDWFDLLSRGNAVGGGLMSRFNIIGTEGGYENVSRMDPPNLTALQETFLPRVMRLEDAHANIRSTEGADRIVSEWSDNLPEGSERMNIHAWRSALLLAWLRHEETITAKTAEDAVRLGQYQVDSHDYYRTQAADNALAKVQSKILRALKLKPALRRELQQRTNAHRDGTTLWGNALDGLLRDKAIGKREDGTYYLAEA